MGGTQHTQQGERERDGEREIWEIGRDGGGTGCLSLVSVVCAHTHTSSTPVPHDSVIFLTSFTRSVPAVCVVTRDTHLSLSLSLSLSRSRSHSHSHSDYIYFTRVSAVST